MPSETPNNDHSVCYHCGSPLRTDTVELQGKSFCCAGCRTVFEILSRHELCSYYDIEKSPGITPPLQPSGSFEALDDPAIKRQLLEYSDGSVAVAHLQIPQIHCSSCVWLLERLHMVDGGILYSRVDFLRKSLLVRFSEQTTSLRSVVQLLNKLGYEPELNLGSTGRRPSSTALRTLYLKLGVAAFCFGNIMLFSLPDYLARSSIDPTSRSMFAWVNLLLSLPVVLYSSTVFFSSSWQGLREKLITIDLPIALGIAIVFLRSVVDVVSGAGQGFFDSLTGLVFLLLIGRLFQSKAYENLNFDRRYESYFPLAMTVRKDGIETSIPVASLRPGDRGIVRNKEIIPADGVVMKGTAFIDYSFVTGEDRPVERNVGDVVFAGGRQVGGAVEVEFVKEVSQSALVQMWSESGAARRPAGRLMTLSNTMAKYFTAGVLLLSAVTATVWWFRDPSVLLDAVSAVLIVACPCALALAAPFAYGTAMRMYGKSGFHLRNAAVVESLGKVDTIVFDKTGTITKPEMDALVFVGGRLTDRQRNLIASLARSSAHPLSQAIAAAMPPEEPLEVNLFKEYEGVGIEGIVDGSVIRLGSAQFAGGGSGQSRLPDESATLVHVSIDGGSVGAFRFGTPYRDGLPQLFSGLAARHRLSILSGDGDAERQRLLALYPEFEQLKFNQTPHNKLEAMQALRAQGRTVMMVGDGLNDAGALIHADVGVAVTDRASVFFPACDAMVRGSSLTHLNTFLEFASSTISVVYWAYGISILYNIAGLYFAVQGVLSPILAAILMPLSSVSVISFTTLVTRFHGKRKGVS